MARQSTHFSSFLLTGQSEEIEFRPSALVEVRMVHRELYEAVRAEVSGSRAKRFVENICQFHRIQASPGFRAAAEYVLAELKRLGVRNCKIESFPSNGRRKYFTWHSPVGWEGKRGRLQMIEPEKRVLASFPDVPCALAAHSNSVYLCAELTDVGTGTSPESYEGQEVKGKIVLCGARTADVVREAVIRRGAVGLVSYIPDREHEPDIVPYNALWPIGGEIKKCGFGFSISRRTADYLKNLLAQGKKVVLKADVEAKSFPSKLDVVTAEIPGQSKKGILFVAHLCHPRPGANDNASGSSLLIELARATSALTEARKIRLKRSIRFMWLPEMYGTLAYLSRHREFRRETLCAINLDMVGENQTRCNSKVRIIQTPWSCPSNLADLLSHAFGQVASDAGAVAPDGTKNLFHFETLPYSGGSDHYILCESSFRVPACMVGNWPDTFYHTDSDSPDKVDATALQKVGVASLFSGLFLATIDTAGLERLLSVCEQYAQKRISDTASALTLSLQNEKSAQAVHRKYYQARNAIRVLVEREILSLLDAIKFIPGKSGASSVVLKRLSDSLSRRLQAEEEKLEAVYKRVCGRLGIKTVKNVALSAAEKKARRMCPRRLFSGPLDVVKSMRPFPDKEKFWRETLKKDENYGQRLYETLNYIDGRRSLLQIIRLVDAQFPTCDAEIALRLADDLKELGLLAF